MRKLRIKILCKTSDYDDTSYWKNYFTEESCVVGDCEFIFHREERNYDWLVVYDDMPSFDKHGCEWNEHLSCNQENTLLITVEPSSIKNYGKRFLNQFGWVLTSQESWAISHKGIIREMPLIVPFYGKPLHRIKNQTPYKKTKILSTICSSKKMIITQHRNRFEFAKLAAARLNYMDSYGRGVRDIEHKYNAIDKYKYHLVMENHIGPYHITEKLADAYLGFSFPIYYGSDDVTKYYPNDSLLVIDINEKEFALQQMEDAIQSRLYEKRLDYVMEARNIYIRDYSFFNRLSKVILERHKSGLPKNSVVFKSRKNILKNRTLEKVSHFTEKMYFKTRALMVRKVAGNG